MYLVSGSSLFYGWFKKNMDSIKGTVEIYDLDERGEVVREAARMIYEDYVMLPAGAYNSFYAYNNRVQDFPTLSWWLNLVTERSNTWISN